LQRRINRHSHVKLMLANSCWQTQVGVCERHDNTLANCWRKVGGNRDKFYICRQQFANMLLCRSHTPIRVCQHELANISLTCEGRLTRQKRQQQQKPCTTTQRFLVVVNTHSEERIHFFNIFIDIRYIPTNSTNTALYFVTDYVYYF